MKRMFLWLLTTGVFLSSGIAIANEVDCRKFDHARAYWIDEDGTPHWRMYTFNADCNEVKIQRWHGDKTVGEPQIDKVDGVFRCLKSSGEVCFFGFSWIFDGAKISSKTERIEIIQNGVRQVKESILRDVYIRQDGLLQEFITSDRFYKERGEQEWFNTKTERSRCILSSLPDCQWNADVQR
ncbi:MAG: hypothetical protein NTV34_11710 [Proteobacteria bacterium]|nr:hypothetical protein [Pseudomonadota bacterium]